jgi:hypothetical protein
MKAIRILQLFAQIIPGLLAALLIFGVPQVSLAQTDYGTLVTIVVEFDNDVFKPLPNQTVNISSERGEQRNCITKADGICRFGSLEPGLYTVEVSSKRQGVIRVPAGEIVTRRIRMELGAASIQGFDTTIKGSSPISGPPVFVGPLEERIKPGRLGITSSASEVEMLSNRNQTVAPLLDLLPGIFEDADQLVINGSRQNVLRTEGLDVTPLELSSVSFQDTGAALAKISDRQSINPYDSFNIDTSNTPAKLGTGTGGQLLRSIKSGKNTFAGKVYEYFANDVLSARNFFDFARKPSLRYNLFGFNVGGRLFHWPSASGNTADDKNLYAFFNYEGIRARSGVILFEAAPSAAVQGRVASALTPLLAAYRAGGATIVDNASLDPNFDILKLDTKNFAEKNGVTLRLDFIPRKLDAVNLIYLGAVSTENIPDGVTGRRGVTRTGSHTGILNYSRTLTQKRDNAGNLLNNPKLMNQFIFGLRNDPVRVSARLPNLAGLNLSTSNLSISGDVKHTGIPGRTAPLSIATPGGLLPGADFARRSLRFNPFQISFIDQLTWDGETHDLSFGGEIRLLRNTINHFFGTTYSFGSLDDFAANRAAVNFVGDLGSFTGVPGDHKTEQEYYIGYGQDSWGIRRNMNLTYGLRYEYYSVLREEDDRAVVFDPVAGMVLPLGTAFYRSRHNNFLPRVSFAWAPDCHPELGDVPRSQRKIGVITVGDEAEEACVIKTNPTVISASFGMHTGPDALDNILRPVTSDRIRARATSLSFPANTDLLSATFKTDPNRRFQPLAIARDYLSPMRVYKFDVTLKRALIKRVVAEEPSGNDDQDVRKELFAVLSYQGTRSRNLLLRNFANRIVSVETNPNPSQVAKVHREFDSVNGDQPFGEIDYFTTGGRARYDSFQATLTGRARKYLRYFQAGYTLARNYGNTDGDSTAGAGNPIDYNYDLGYITGDVRHKFSFGTVFIIPECKDFKPCVAHQQNPFLRELLGGWNFGFIGNFQSGAPIDLRINRPDVVYVDAAGNVFGSPAVGLHAVLNVPGGGSSVAAYRPNLIPGKNPYTNGFADRRFLNPDAFSTPGPGELGNLRRGALRGPGLRIVSLSFRKDIKILRREEKAYILNFYTDITNLFNFTNFKLTSAKLPNVLGLDASKNQLQPGESFTTAAAPDFGVLTRTAKSRQDLGSSRQIQFGLALSF